MSTLSEIQFLSGISASKLKLLSRFGLQFEEDDFQIDSHHHKALNDLRNKRLSSYVLAYALHCRSNYHNDDFNRSDNISDLARWKDLSISEALSDIRWRQIEAEVLDGAKYWIDRCCQFKADLVGLERMASWCKAVLATAPPYPVDYVYLGSRLLFSIEYAEMPAYPKLVQKTMNRIKHYGFLDGWYRVEKPEGSKPKTTYFRPKFDL